MFVMVNVERALMLVMILLTRFRDRLSELVERGGHAAHSQVSREEGTGRHGAGAAGDMGASTATEAADRGRWII